MKKKILVLDAFTNGHEAALAFIRKKRWRKAECEIVFCGSHANVCTRLSEGPAYAVVPTRNSIAGGVLAFAEWPGEWERLRADRTLLPTAVEEILRWTSATAYNRRTATVDVELGGVTIRAGQKTTHWYPAANRDETVFADPDRFDVGRDPNPHLAFGHGIHHCLGASLARMEIATMLETLLDRCAGFEVVGPVEWGRSNKHTSIRHLPCRLLGSSARASA